MNALPETLPSPATTLPALPAARGPISAALFNCLASPMRSVLPLPEITGDPLSDDDLQLALYTCYELHYRGFVGVDSDWEWRPALLEFRGVLEAAFEQALIDGYFEPSGEPVVPRLLEVSRRRSPPLSRYLRGQANIDQFREFVIHRSAYQLKEADPHNFAVSRLEGKAKAAMVEIQYDEYGSGNLARMHSQLFAKTMRAVGLDAGYGHYLDRIPGVTLATVNLVTMFSLHRRWRGAAVGHLALFEMSSSEPNRRYGDGMRRLGFGPEATDFYDEHVLADAVHEAIALHDLAGSLAKQEPELVDDIVFGAAACAALDGRWAHHVLESWMEGKSSLRSG